MDDKQGAILDHFKRGGTLTVVTCRELYHTTELRRVVSRLKQADYPIEGRKLNGDIYKTYRMATIEGGCGYDMCRTWGEKG